MTDNRENISVSVCFMLDLSGSGWVGTEQEGKLVDSSEFMWWSFSVSLCAGDLYRSSSCEGAYVCILFFIKANLHRILLL